MSALTRRALLRRGALAGAVVAVPLGVAALRQAGLVVFDSALGDSRAFARGIPEARRIDLAAERRTRFTTLRSGLPQGGTIEGLTRWSDWVALRSELERQGWRLAAERRTGRAGNLFRWTMRRA